MLKQGDDLKEAFLPHP
ncbi:hypothetical protein QN277_018577 [Acacia crassicarpa]|uniref:Uncharacterized protein n=1 Tax=Acacia crassicarpa TaxID=499986 RepID=A0AAE1JUT9_9FABA|nr:hypothetical protein QN277_018577 [Acacia crassicarpa]